MDITLSWDLFVIVFFGIIISYSFIIGKHESVKIVVFTYIAIVAGLAAGNILERLFVNSQSLLMPFGIATNMTILNGVKLILFIAIIVLLTIRGGFDVEYGNDESSIINMLLTGLFGFATAGLLLTALLTFAAGVPFLNTQLAGTVVLSPLLQQSKLMQAMILYQEVWFVLPALLLIGVGIMRNRDGGK